MVFAPGGIGNVSICNPPDIQTLSARNQDVVPYQFAIAPGQTAVLVVFQRASDGLLTFNVVGANLFANLQDSTVNTIDIEADFSQAFPIEID
jgi:hypothetical protein